MNREFALSQTDVRNLPFDQYQKDFTFIVNGKRYLTSRIIADLLSPIITNNHFNDSTNEEFIINTSNDDDHFNDFLELAQFKKITLDAKKRMLFSEYFLQLGNIKEYISLINLDLPACENEEDQSLEILEKINEFTIFNAHIQKHIENICKHFSTIDKERLKNISFSFLEEIIKSDTLQLEEEDELFEFVIKLYEKDRSYSELFEYIDFLNVSESKLKKFIEVFSVDDMNSHVWKSICNRLIPKFNEKKENENRYSKQKKILQSNVKEFEYIEGKEFDGIMNFLTNETGGNIHDNATIEIVSNSVSQGNPKFVVDYNSKDTYYDPNCSFIGSYVRFDFKDKCIQLSGYSIKSFSTRFLKNWSIEVSNDGLNWEEIDRHENDESLKGKFKNAVFKISKENNNFYRFVRIVETGCRWDDDSSYDGDFSMIEFFGKLQQPLFQ